MNIDKFNTLIYALVKNASTSSFSDFLETWGIEEVEYARIMKHLQVIYGIKPYISMSYLLNESDEPE